MDVETTLPSFALVALVQGMWPFEEGHTSTNCWCEPDGDYFRVRGANYLRDRKKVSAGKTFADLVAVDWFVDYQRIDDLCSRPTGTCQREILVRVVNDVAWRPP